MTDDQFKRASLSGKGWEIMQGKSAPATPPPTTMPETPPSMPLSNEETDALLAVTPPPLGLGTPPASASPIDSQTVSRIQNNLDNQSIVGHLDNQNLAPEHTSRQMFSTGEAVPQVEGQIAPMVLDLSQVSRPVNPSVEAITPHAPEVSPTASPKTPTAQPANDTRSKQSITTALRQLGIRDLNTTPDFAAHNVTHEDIATRHVVPPLQFKETPSEGESLTKSFSDSTTEVYASATSTHTELTLSELIDNLPIVPEPEELTEPYATYPTNPAGMGGILGPWVSNAAEVAGTILEGANSPIGKPYERVKASQLFGQPQTANPNLLNKLVKDTDIRDLWRMIEGLQEKLVENVNFDRAITDTYQQELLEASNLILADRANYDDARAIVYRVRTDIQRDNRIYEAILRYRPRLLVYFGVWIMFLAWMVLINSNVEKFSRDTLELTFFGEAHLPMVFGAVGGLMMAYLTLEKHTTKRRDFDPIHIPWYIFSPVVGGLMGFLMFLLVAASIATTVTTSLASPETLSEYPVIIWLLAFVAGLQQNFVLDRLRSLVGKEEKTPENPPQVEVKG